MLNINNLRAYIPSGGVNKMKFNNGQLLEHTPTKSLWIVTSTQTVGLPVSCEKILTAYCLYSGTRPEFWQPNELDVWILNSADCAADDTKWITVN